MQRIVFKFTDKEGKPVETLAYHLAAGNLIPAPLSGITHNDVEYVLRSPKYVASQQTLDIVFIADAV